MLSRQDITMQLIQQSVFKQPVFSYQGIQSKL